MPAVESCIGSLVAAVYKLVSFAGSAEGRLLIIGFAAVQFTARWLWRKQVAEARDLAIAICAVYAAVCLALVSQAGVPGKQVMQMCYPAKDRAAHNAYRRPQDRNL
ncbi:MAG: hypothetical protein WBX25_20525 [Rhodomicrobium sp.]